MKQLSIVLLAFSLSGCPGFGDKTIDELTDGKDITYESHIKAILDARCATCHGETPIAGASNSLHDYATASAQVERIHARSVVELTMPPGAALSPEDRALIDAWYRAGAPEGTPSRDAGMMNDVSMPPDDAMPPLDDGGMTTPTWDDPIVGIMRNSCAFTGCHAGERPSADLDLSDYAGYEAGGTEGDLTGGGDPAMSLFIDHLRARNGKLLMPLGADALPEAQIMMFERWIAAGSPEN